MRVRVCVCMFVCVYAHAYIYRREHVCIFDIYFQMVTFLKMGVYIYMTYMLFVSREVRIGKNFPRGLEYCPR